MRARTSAVLGVVAGLALASAPARSQAPGPAASSDTLTLAAAVRAALGHSADVATARANVSTAAAGRLAAWGAFLPTASASLSLNRSSFTAVTYTSPEGVSQRLSQPITDVSKVAGQGLSFNWDLLDGGRRFAELGATAAETRAADFRFTEAQRKAASTVKQAYYDALLQQRLAAMAADELDARRRDLEVTRRRYDIAAVGRGDLLGAEVQVRQAEARVDDARDGARKALRQLEVALGRPGEAPEDLVLANVGPMPDADALDADALVRRAESGSPELSALRADVAAADSRVWSARSQYLPTLRIGFGLSRSEQLGAGGSFFTLNPSNHSSSFFVGASWNLFSGFSRHQEAASAAAAKDQALASHAEKSHEIQKEVRDLVADVKRGQRRLTLQRQIADLSRQRVELAREQFRLGTLSYIELQSVIDRATAAQQAVAQDLHDARVAWAKLEERVGGAR